MTVPSKPLKELFLSALEVVANDRAEWLDRECAGDEGLREQLNLMLAAHDAPHSLLDQPAMVEPGSTISQIITEKPGTQVGPYKLLQQVGEGGMGVVYMAEQEEPVRRQVALKIVKPGMDSSHVVARFEAERQALALMDHPNIARVVDAGTTESGRPFFVMDLVKGVPITEYCDENQLAPQERLKLFQQVCDAIQHAHQKGIIHRDIKPSNVLVAQYDGNPIPKVIDFGIAKATEQRLTERTLFTGFGQFLGTAEYMSPEQAELNQLDVDTRSDVYSLGVLLYELLTGSTPLSREQLHGAGLEAMLRTVRETEPPKPSTRISESGEALAAISRARKTDPTKLSRFMQGDLDWIVMKALDKDRDRRYDTANNFAADVKRFLSNEAVHACPPSRAYMLRKFVARHRGPLTAAAGLLLMLCLGLAGTSLGLFWARSAENEASRERDRAIAARDAEAEARAKAEHRRKQAHQERLRAEESEEESQRRLVRLTIANGMRHLEREDLLSSLPWFTEALQLERDDAARSLLHRMRIRIALSQCPKLIWMWYHEGPVTHETGTLELKLSTNAEFSPDGRYVVAPSGNSTARVWDTETGQVVHVLSHEIPVLHATFSRDGRKIVTASGELGGGHAGFATVWDAGTGEQIGRLTHGEAVLRASFSPDGRRLVTGSLDNTARVWDMHTGEPITPPMKHGDRVISVSFSPDGSRLATASRFQTARIWNSFTGQPLTPSIDGHRHIAFSPDGSRVVTAGSGARVWEAESGKLVATFVPRDTVWHASFSPDGQLIVTASHDRTAQVWEVATGNPVGAPLRHFSAVTQARFSPDSRRVVTGSWDRTARVWDANTGRPVTLPLKHGGDVMCAAFSPDGHRIVTASTDLLVRVWELASLKGTSRPLRHSDRLNWATFSRDGQRVVTASDDGSARVWDTVTGEPVTPPLKHGGAVRYAAFSPNGQRVLTTHDDGTARVWDVNGGEPTSALLKHGARPVVHGSFSSDGSHVATASENGTAQVWDVITGETVAILQHSGPVNVAWFGPDGQHLLTCSHDGTACVWDAETANLVIPPLKHKSAVLYASFSADGLHVLTTSSDGTARVWNAATGQLTGAPLWHGQAVYHGAFSPDGRRVVTASNDNTARVWDAMTGEPLTPPLGWRPSNPHCASFSADGRLVATAWGEGVARVWDATTGEPLSGPLVHGHVQAEFSPTGCCLLTASTDGTARLWDLLPDDRPVEDLVTLAQVLCGHRIDPTGGSLEPVDPSVLRDAWRSLRDKYPSDFAASSRELFTWHFEEAVACEQIERWSDAINHLEAAQRYTSDASNLSRCSNSLIRLQRLRAEADGIPVP